MMFLMAVYVCSMRRNLNFFERAYLLARSNNLPPRAARAYARLCIDYWLFCEPSSFPYLKAFGVSPFTSSNYLKSLY